MRGREGGGWQRNMKDQLRCWRGKYFKFEYVRRAVPFEALVTEKSDCFSLGVVLYLLLTGEHPFGDGNDPALLKLRNAQAETAQLATASNDPGAASFRHTEGISVAISIGVERF